MIKPYILDTNIYITAKNKLYPFDIFPSFWNQIIEKAENQEIYMTDEIYEELLAGKDELSEWIKDNKNSFKFLKSDEFILISNYSTIISDIQNQELTESAKNEFAKVADSWIIAHALTYDCILVTQEKQVDFNCKKRVKIPNVCHSYNIECIDIIDFMRKTNFRF